MMTGSLSAEVIRARREEGKLTTSAAEHQEALLKRGETAAAGELVVLCLMSEPKLRRVQEELYSTSCPTEPHSQRRSGRVSHVTSV